MMNKIDEFKNVVFLTKERPKYLATKNTRTVKMASPYILRGFIRIFKLKILKLFI